MTRLVEKDPIHIVEEDNIQPPPHYEAGGRPQILTADTARQAPKGVPVLWVLIGGLVIVGLAWLGINWFVH
jgi:hypothetical protein